MNYDSVFDSTENQALLVVCARKTIRTAAILGIVWGVINLAIGLVAVQASAMNVGILILAILMLGAGLAALRKPSLHSLLNEAVVSALLLAWNVGVAVINARTGYADHIDAHSLIWPLIAAVVFFRQYFRLGHLKEAIGTMDHSMIKEARTLCKQLFKTRLKQSPDVVQASSKRYRARLMTDSIFCAQRSLAQAFHMNRDQFRNCIANPEKQRLHVVVRHPLGKIACRFDKKNSDKIRNWLSVNAQPVV